MWTWGTNTSKEDLKGTREDPSHHQVASKGPDSAVPLTGQRADFFGSKTEEKACTGQSGGATPDSPVPTRSQAKS